MNLEGELPLKSAKNRQSFQFYGICALTSSLLVGLSLWYQLPQLTQTDQAVKDSISVECHQQ